MSTQPPVPYRYYPRLSSVVSENDIPDILGFIKTGIVNLLDHIYFKDFQQSKSPKGDSAFYGISIVSKVLKIEIPGTGINLVLNPDLSDEPGSNYISVFPITIEYQWKILGYLRFFSVGNFSFDPMQIFEVALRILNITEEQAIAHFVNTFVEPEDQNITPLQQFVKDINEANDWNINPPTQATTLSEVVQEIFDKSAGKYASLVAFGTYLSTSDLEETSAKVKVYFRSLIPQDVDEFIKDVILPKFRATLLLSAAIEFPRSILKPVYREGTNDGSNPPNDISFDVMPEEENNPGYPKVLLSFAEALFYADTEKGFGYNLDLVLNTNYPAMIGNTGLIIDIQNLKIDLSKTENIAEADADGRPKEFMGVYMEYTEIFLPKKWFKKNPGQTIGISANHLLVGTGGISGNIAVRATYKTEIVDNKSKVVSYFKEWFDLQYPLNVKGKESFVVINNHNELLLFINTVLDSPSKLKFEYPISLQLKGTAEEKNFRNETEYYQFLQSLPPVLNPTDYKSKFIWFDLGPNEKMGWKLGFQRFDIDFYHGQVVHSYLHASLEIKKFKTVDDEGNHKTLFIDLEGEWVDKDDFRLSAAFLPDGFGIPIFKFLTLTLQTAEIGKSDGVFYIGADTKISFPKESLAGKIFKTTEIDLPALRIYANGKLEFVGGTSFIPVDFNLPLGPIDMSVKGIHLGSVQREFNGVIRDYNYIGFDGSMSIDPVGLDVTGSGVKYYYTTDNDKYGDDGDSFFHISRIDLDLIIPGNVSESKAIAIIKGSLTIPDPGVSAEYTGSVSVKIPKAKISGNAAMKFYPKYSAFYIEAGLELPAPIPLGPIGIFGFHGLIGKKYVAEKESAGMNENNTWYDYYMAEPRGINTDKFSTPPKTLQYSNPFSVGIGASLAIIGGERIASLRAMMLLSIPSVFVIDAGFTILSEKLGLAEEDNPRRAPFYAFVAIGDDSLELGAGADFGLNKTNGWFLDIHAEIQMGFFFRNQRPWYINFGTSEKPITASLLKDIFNIRASAFLMIAAKGIEAGARVSFDLNLLGFIKVWAIIEVGAHVSFERPQIGGFIYLEGGAEIELWIAKLGFMLSVYLSLEMVKPFLIFAQLRLRFELRIGWGWLSFTIKFSLTITLKWEKNRTIDAAPIAPLTIDAVTNNPDFPKDKRVNDFVKGIHMLTNEEFELEWSRVLPNANAISNTIPLDTFLDIKLEKGVVPSLEVDSIIGGHTGIANNCIEKIPPKREQPGGYSLRQVIHKYSIEKIELKAWNPNKRGGTWENYNPYKAMFNEEELNHLRIGQWQRNNDQYDTIRILGTTPFSFMDFGESGWFIPEEYGITPSELFCQYTVQEKHRSNFLNIPLGTIYYPPTQYPAHLICDAYYAIEGVYSQSFEIDENGNVVQTISEDKMVIRNAPNPFVQEGSNLPYNHSLEFGNFNNLIITPPEAIANGQLLLTTYAQSVTIEYYRKTGATTIKPKYEKIGEVSKTRQQLASPVDFNMENMGEGKDPISQIRIIPETHDKNRINEILEEIAQIYYIAELRVSGSGIVTLTTQEQAALDILEAELENLRKKSCKDVGCKDLPFEVLDYFDGSDTDAFDSSVINDELSYYSFFEKFTNFLEYVPPVNINFNTHSIVIACVHSGIDWENRRFRINKVIDSESNVTICVETLLPPESSNDGLELRRAYFIWAIIKVEKIHSKPVIVSHDNNCGCSENGNPPFASVCTTAIQELNWMTMTEYEYYQTIPGQDAIDENTNAMMEAINRAIQPIWRPNTKYYLHFQLKDEVRINDDSSGQGIFDYYYGFQTKGPLGHFHKQVLSYIEPGTKEGEYALTSLKSYIDYKRSYPNADGNLLMSKPLFYGHGQCELNIYFDVVYTPQMFSEWYDYNDLGMIKGEMAIMIKDPVSDTIIPYPLPEEWEDEDVPKPDIEWSDDTDPRLPLSVQTIINYVNYVNQNSNSVYCKLDLGNAISPKTKFWTVKLTNLKPEKLYTALIYNAYDENGDGEIENQTETENGIEKIKYEENQKVHEYVFRTSRYQNFREQVMSYKLKKLNDNDEVIHQKQAVYEIRKADGSAWINDLYALVSGSSTPRTAELELQYLHEFDRAIEGVLELSPLDPPRNTEFIKIIDEQNEDLVAILVRNPEPFNDPKMPLLEVSDTLKILETTSLVPNYNVLWSKDYSKAIIMFSSKKITEPNIQFVFRYKTWDGILRKYDIKEEKETDENEKLYTVITEPIIFND